MSNTAKHKAFLQLLDYTAWLNTAEGRKLEGLDPEATKWLHDQVKANEPKFDRGQAAKTPSITIDPQLS